MVEILMAIIATRSLAKFVTKKALNSRYRAVLDERSTQWVLWMFLSGVAYNVAAATNPLVLVGLALLETYKILQYLWDYR